jgi:hypothetical protein
MALRLLFGLLLSLCIGASVERGVAGDFGGENQGSVFEVGSKQVDQGHRRSGNRQVDSALGVLRTVQATFSAIEFVMFDTPDMHSLIAQDIKHLAVSRPLFLVFSAFLI